MTEREHPMLEKADRMLNFLAPIRYDDENYSKVVRRFARGYVIAWLGLAAWLEEMTLVANIPTGNMRNIALGTAVSGVYAVGFPLANKLAFRTLKRAIDWTEKQRKAQRTNLE